MIEPDGKFRHPQPPLHSLRDVPRYSRYLLRKNLLSALHTVGLIKGSEMLAPFHERKAVFYGDRPNSSCGACIEPWSAPPHGEPKQDGAELAAWVLRYGSRDTVNWQYTVSDLVYDPDGVARLNGAIEPDLSSRWSLGVADVLLGLLVRPAEVLDQGTIIERDHPNTYGDFCSEDLKPLVLADRIIEPVIFPKSFKTRDYVHRHMRQLGISYRFAERPLRIRRVLVLRKTQQRTQWSLAEASEYRKRLGLGTIRPRPGSVIYLSRKNVRSARDMKGGSCIDSDTIADEISSRGGQVVETEGMVLEDFLRLAGEAETVVADHGAAMFNMLLWNPVQVVEIVPDDWWSTCFVLLSQHLKVRRHIILNAGHYAPLSLQSRLGAILESSLCSDREEEPTESFVRYTS